MMTGPKAKLLRTLLSRRGLRAAISAHDLSIVLGIDEADNRTGRRWIEELNIDDGCCIGSVPKEGGGYFIPETTDELALIVADRRGRAAKNHAMADALEKNFPHRFDGPRQQDLLGGESWR